MTSRDGPRRPEGSGRPAGMAEGEPLDPRAILTSLGEAVYDWDLAGDVLTWGANAAEVFGAADMGALANGRDYATAVEPGSGGTRHDAIFSATARDQGSGVPYRARYAIRLIGGQPIGIEDSGRWYGGPDGRPVYAHGVVRIERAPNKGLNEDERGGLLARLKTEIARARTTKQPLTLLIAAIDRLGEINAELGFESTDRVIAAATGRVASVLRQRDHSAHYAGNRFAVVMTACAPDQAALAAQRIAAAVESAAVDTDQGPIGLRLVLGAASLPDHALDASTLLRRAEAALSRASASLGQAFVLYDPAFERSDRFSTTPRSIDVVDALNDRRIDFALQPVVDAATRKPVFHEALLRIRTLDGSHVGAGTVLPAIERAGLVPMLDQRMLELVADQLQADPQARISLNLSPLTLESGGWLPTLSAHLNARPGIAGRLVVEVTETAAVRDPRAIGARLEAMKALGIAIAIDDFGAGHTSFKHLRSFPVDFVKIDGAFVQNLASSRDDQFFVRALVDLARHLGIATVAEWVEDEASAAMLAGWGVDLLQGDHCGPPRIVAQTPRRLAEVA